MEEEEKPMRVFINGFGRIGRLVARRILEIDHRKLSLSDRVIMVVGINDVADTATLAHLFVNDSTHGKLKDYAVEAQKNNLVIFPYDNWPVYSLRNLQELPLDGVDIVVEATGVFTKRSDLTKHLERGARGVILTAPARGAQDVDVTLVMGVNEESLDPENHRIISNASCTTNCLAPVVKVLHENFGVVQGMMNTVHAYTNDQKVQDVAHKDLRRARAAGINIIPTSTGAARAIGLVLPELAGRLDGMSLRVPVEDGSAVYLVAELAREVTQEELVAAFEEASRNARYNSLLLSRDKLVSRDVIGTEHSAIVDQEYLKVLGGRGRMVQVLAWYDNEWAYSCRVVDLIRYIGERKALKEA